MPKKSNKMTVAQKRSLGGMLGGLLGGGLGSILPKIPGLDYQQLGQGLGSMTGLKRGGIRRRRRGGK